MADRSFSPVFLGSVFIGVPLLVAVAWMTDWSEALRVFVSYELIYVAWFAAFAVANLLSYTLIWLWFLELENVAVPWWRAFNYRMAGGAISYVTPGPRLGGELTRADLVSSETSWRIGLSTSFGEKAVLFVSGLLFDTSVVTTAVLFSLSAYYGAFVLVSVVVGLVVIAALLYGLKRVSSQSTVVGAIIDTVVSTAMGQHVANVKDDLSRYATSYPWRMALIVAFGVGTKALIAAQFYALVLGAGFHVSFWEACVLAAALDIAYSIPSYMGLGALEGGQVAAASWVGLSTGVGVIIALLARLRDLTMSAYGLLVLLYYGGMSSLTSRFD
jgi:uncharacterized membrane protein YbhN (UPF0104 family)